MSQIVLDQAAHDWLAKGYDKLFGARPLGRVIQENVKKPLAEELLFGKLTKGGVVKVSVDKETDKLSFAYEEAARPAASRDAGRAPDAPKEPEYVGLGSARHSAKRPPSGGLFLLRRIIIGCRCVGTRRPGNVSGE